MYELYPYQNNGVSLLSAGFKSFLRQLLVMPTGAGKTVVFSEIIRRAVTKGTTVLVLTDRKELHKQTIRAVKPHGIPVCEINQDNRQIHASAKLFIGMVETVARRIELIKQINFGLIIVDESHKSNFFKVLDAFPNVRAIGCTATPINKRLHLYYQNLIQPIDIPELVANGFLTNCKAYQMVDDFSDLKVKGNEYTDESLFKHYHKAKLYAGLVDEYKKHLLGKKTMVFCVNVKHVIETYNMFKSLGYPAYFVHSDKKTMSDADRDYMIRSFENDPAGIMINCGILATGYDHPPIIGVVIYRKTKSLALWLQMQGRGSRIYRNKDYFIVLDFGRNHDELGLWCEPRTWTLEPPKKNKKLGAAPIKKCKQCEAVIPASSVECTFCGYKYVAGDAELKEGVMVEVKPRVPSTLVGKKVSDLSIEEIAELQKSKAYKPTYAWRVIRSKGEESIKEYAEKMGYKQGWIDRQVQEIENSQFKNYVLK